MRRSKGFTLIELIVIISIIAILVGIGTVGYKGYTKEAEKAHIINTIKELESASSRYYMNKGEWPRKGDTPYTSEELDEYIGKIHNLTGDTVELESEGKYYAVDYTGLGNYIRVPKGKENYVIQNPVGSIYYIDRPIIKHQKDPNVKDPVEEPEILHKGIIQDTIKQLVKSGIIIPNNMIEEAHEVIYNENATQQDIQNMITKLNSITEKVPENVEIENSGFIFNVETKTITGYTGISTDVIIPKSFIVGGISHEVKIIGDNAFQYKKLTSIVLPDGITTIGKAAFASNSLTNVIIPDSVTSIGTTSFRLNQLKHVVLSNNITNIPENAFDSNKLQQIIIPDNVKIIGNYAFNNNQLTNIELGNTVELGFLCISSSFITDYESTGKLKGIYKSTAQNGRWANNYPWNIKNIGEDYEIVGYTGNNKIVEIPNTINGKTVTSIGANAFYNKGITSVIIPNTVTNIGNTSFHANELTNIIIPNGVTTIGSRAFSSNKLENITLPEGLKYLGTSAFENNQLTSVIIPNSLIKINMYTFQYNQLTHIRIGDNVEISGTAAISSSFNTAYNVTGKASGTYTSTSQGGTWTKQ